ncbi:hypothetical protein CU098_005566, partial [Rhizopus stolonifer]
MSLNGHSVYCVDPKVGPTDQSRAIGVTSRTMEILEKSGLAGEFLEDGFVSSGFRMYNKGTLVGQMDSIGDTPYAFMTVVMQSRTEYILNKHLEEETEYPVHWETELISYTQNDDKVTSTVLDKRTGLEHTIESKYIIGADGSHSRVRKENSAFTYDGVAIDTKFFLADLNVKGEGFENRLDKGNMFMTPLGFMGMVPFQSCLDGNKPAFRIFGNLEAYSVKEKGSRPTHGLIKTEEAPSLEFIQSFVDEAAAPFKFELSNLIWSSYFKINERIVNTYRHKRAFLMGDAAHCHSPAGGQGMNLGLQDADNLAWKLSIVLKGHAIRPDELLDSYESERKPQAEETLRSTGNATKGGISSGYFASALRNIFMSTALYVPRIREFLFKTTMQQLVTIDSTHSKILGISDKGLIQAGHFLPNTGTIRLRTLEKRTAQLKRLNLREIMIGLNKFSIILIGTSPSGTNPNSQLIEAFWNLARLYPVKRIVIESSWHTHFNRYPDFVLEEEKQDGSFYAEENMDSPVSVTKSVGLSYLFPKYTNGPTPSVLLFVRPDFYVAQSKVVYCQ